VKRARSANRAWCTTSQPQKGACQQNSTAPLGPSWRRLAVGPTQPADWGTRSTRSHLGKCPEHEILFFAGRGVAPGVRPIQGQVSPKGAGGQGGLGSSRSLAGFRPAAPAGAGGARRSAACGGQKYAPLAGTVSSVESTTAAPLRCYCGALANHRAQVECVTGRTAPPRLLRRCRVGGFDLSAI
jgi:hypothetical protein